MSVKHLSAQYKIYAMLQCAVTMSITAGIKNAVESLLFVLSIKRRISFELKKKNYIPLLQ